MHSSEKTVSGKYSDIPSSRFWQYRTEFFCLILSMFEILSRFCILYKYNCCVKFFLSLIGSESACLILRRGSFSNNKRASSTFWSLTPGLPLPPMCSTFPSCSNRVCQNRIVLRDGGFLWIVVYAYLCATVIDSFLMYLATINAFSASVNAIFPIVFRVKNFEVMCVRCRLCRILFLQKGVLYKHYISQ